MKRILFIIALTAAGIVASFSLDAFFGVLLYSFYAFVSPQYLTYGALLGSRLSFVVAGVVIASAVIQRKNLLPASGTVYLLIVFIFVCGLSLLFSPVVSPYEWWFYELFVRITIMTIIVTAIIDTPERLRLYILAVAGFSGLLNAYYGFGGLVVGSESIIGAGRIGDNNGYAVWLNTTIPIIYYVGLHLKKLQWRIMAKIVLIGNILASMLTFSRGGFITLAIVLLMLFLTMKRKWIIAFACLSLAVAGLIVLQSPRETRDAVYMSQTDLETLHPVDRVILRYRERIETLRQTPADIQTAASRMHFWSTALRMANANPLLGVGFNCYQAQYDTYDMSGGEYGTRKAVHNSLLSVLSETGYVGFIVFIMFAGSCVVAISKTKMISAKLSDTAARTEYADYCKMLYTSMIAFFLGGFFVNAQYQETFWALVTISVSMHRIVGAAAAGSCEEPIPSIRSLSQRFFGR